MASRNSISLAQISILQSKKPKPYKLQNQKPFELSMSHVETITPTTSWTRYLKYCIKLALHYMDIAEIKQKYLLPLTWLSSPQDVSLCTGKYYNIQNAFQDVKINKSKSILVSALQIWCTDPDTLVNVSILSRDGQSWGSWMLLFFIFPKRNMFAWRLQSQTLIWKEFGMFFLPLHRIS